MENGRQTSAESVKLQGSNEIMGKQVTHYDDTAKTNAAYLYAAFGNYSKVARDTNIPRTTIVSWAKDSVVWVDSLVKARQEISDEILAQNHELVIESNKEVLDRVQNGDHKLVKTKKAIKHDDGSLEVSEDYELKRVPMSGRDLAVVGGIKEDKARVALGQATSITSNQDNRALSEVCKELSRTMSKELGRAWTEKQVNVVATQEKSEEIE